VNALLSWLLTFFAPVQAELAAPQATVQVTRAPTAGANAARSSSDQGRTGDVLLGFLDISNGF
jgi:hypothetical protein